MLETGVDRMTSRDLVAALCALPNAPWATALDGKPITQRWLAAKLRPLGLRPRILRFATKRLNGYSLKDLVNLPPTD